MINDVYFYDFELNKVYELPSFGAEKGYISVNATIDFCGAGSLEIVFVDEKLKSLINDYQDNLIVVWRNFQGFLTGHQFEETCRLFGMSLNGLLHRIVIPKTVTTLSGDVETLARTAISANASWLTLGGTKGFDKEVKYATNKYEIADKYISELLTLDNAGYVIFADTKSKKYIFEVLKSEETELLLSTNNLNAYAFSESYSNKTVAFGGWYEQEQSDGSDPVWTYITLDETLSGINKIDTVLSAKSEDEALQDLETKKAEFTTDLKTRKIVQGIDYNIGDIVRVQNNGVATKKRIIGINMSMENGFVENPILSEVE